MWFIKAMDLIEKETCIDFIPWRRIFQNRDTSSKQPSENIVTIAFFPSPLYDTVNVGRMLAVKEALRTW